MPKKRIYTGIGARGTPAEVLELMTAIARDLDRRKWILRSGGAPGADTAFELGSEPKRREIYLPWKKFNKRGETPDYIWDIPPEAEEIASKVVPHWHNCNGTHRKFHSRNVCQVLGKSLDRHSDIVLAWTFEGKLIGGTATALALAIQEAVPIINLGSPEYEGKSCKEILYAIDDLVGLGF